MSKWKLARAQEPKNGTKCLLMQRNEMGIDLFVRPFVIYKWHHFQDCFVDYETHKTKINRWVEGLKWCSLDEVAML